MLDIRWFSEAEHGNIIVPYLQALGLSIAQSGDEPARLVMAMGNTTAPDAWRYARRHHCGVVQFIWDLPPWRLGSGRYDPVVSVYGRLFPLPRLGSRYPERANLYSKLRYVAAHARALWVPSVSTAADVHERFGIHGDHIHYCYDSDRFTPGGHRSAAATLLSISRLVWTKNHEAVIRAGHRLNMAVRIIGLDSGPTRDALAKLAADLHVPCSIEHGWLTNEDVVAAYRQATVVVSARVASKVWVSPD